jgi:glycerate kinase
MSPGPIVLAPNAFKGSLTAANAAKAMARGVLKAYPQAQICEVPFADGGDGLSDIFMDLFQGESRFVSVTGPLGKKIVASFCWVVDQGLAAIEMAKASGLALLAPNELNPLEATTFGTGELIKAALDFGIEHVIVGIGGSATNDGGVGMAAALGVKFLDKLGHEVQPIGRELQRIMQIDITGLDPRIFKTRIQVICDVDNPLIGENGAAWVYAPQKGANAEQVKELELGLVNLASVIEKYLGKNVRFLPGAGAAGGLGGGLYSFLNAELRPGVQVTLDLVGLKEKIQDADLVLTAEGRIDEQIAYGKGLAGVACCARDHNVPCIVVAGSIAEKLPDLDTLGINAVFSLCPGPVSLEDAMENASNYLERTSEQVVRTFRAGID